MRIALGVGTHWSYSKQSLLGDSNLTEENVEVSVTGANGIRVVPLLTVLCPYL